MDAAFEAGINFFDTADVYGGPQSPDMKKGYGVSEETVGRWLQRTGRRDDIVLATKVYQPMGLGPNDRRLSAYHLRRACKASLRRLHTRGERSPSRYRGLAPDRTVVPPCWGAQPAHRRDVMWT
ncbi:hypothetical protein GCM10020369_00840 [Cryptosporangium minutisporangium]|uniref:NADP-dependent oxidoreductase domain-containing protein n=1 Tax=Cryptosporangium minutisporangium TaxID=113569 RepID=A0ABP6SPN5_9ACTN